MALTPSRMVALQTPAAGFELEGTDGRKARLEDFAGARALVVMFLCNHCPFVRHLRAALAEFGRECEAVGVAVVAINSNDAERYPADSPARMVEEVREAGWGFPYLYDATQEVATAYGAACTPDFFLFDGTRRLVYRGQFDDSRPGNGKPITGKDLRAAIRCVLEQVAVEGRQVPSMGCNIKWRPGREPARR